MRDRKHHFPSMVPEPLPEGSILYQLAPGSIKAPLQIEPSRNTQPRECKDIETYCQDRESRNCGQENGPKDGRELLLDIVTPNTQARNVDIATPTALPRLTCGKKRVDPAVLQGVQRKDKIPTEQGMQPSPTRRRELPSCEHRAVRH